MEYAYINTAVNFGWVSGVGNNRFEPDHNITRAEATALFNKMLNRTSDKAYIDANPKVNVFNDVNKNHWAYYEIMEASISHLYEVNDMNEEWK